MAKYYGAIGFLRTVEDPKSKGVWVEEITERNYYGDVLSNRYKSENGTGLNDDVAIQNTISILGDSFANKNLGYMKYLTWMGSKWKISSIEVAYPRLILSIGGLYNGPIGHSDRDEQDPRCC